MQDITRIMLVDDHQCVREAIAQRLSQEPGFLVCGQAGTANEALKRIHSTAPDVILLDIEMPGRDCFDAASTIGAMLPDAKIIFFSAFAEDHHIARALHVKARAYVTKTEDLDTVVHAIREVVCDRDYFSPKVRPRIVIGPNGASVDDKADTILASLSPRELQILRYIAMEMTDKEMGEAMGRSPKTVNNHVDRLMKKLDIHSRTGLVKYAIRNGVVYISAAPPIGDTQAPHAQRGCPATRA